MEAKHANRNDFNLIKSKYNKIGKSAVRLTQSSLFLTKLIDATKSTYDFDVLENQTATLQNDEIRLNINDEFVVTHMGLFLYGTWNLKGSTTVKGRQVLTYAPIELDSNAALVKDLYAGTLKVSVNNIVYMEKFDTKKCELVPVTQFSNWQPLIAGNSNTGFPSTQPAGNIETAAMIKISPMLTLSGAKKNDITLRLPNSITGGSYEWTNNKNEIIQVNINAVALRLYGLNAQNGARFQN